MLFNHLKTGIRALVKSRISSLINLAGLTLGITACLAIYVVVSYELSYDTFHPGKEQIYRLVGMSKPEHAGEWHPVGFIPGAVPASVREEVSGIAKIAAFHNIYSDVLVPEDGGRYKRFEGERTGRTIVAEPGYFDIFHYEWLAGDPQQALNAPFRVVLSEERARSFFGELPPEGMLGKELVYLDSIRVMVAGIVKTWTRPSDLGFTDFISFATIRASQLKKEINLDEWEDIFSASQAYVMLPAGTRPEQLRGQFESFGKVHYQGDFKFIPALQPLSDVHFNSDYQDNYSRKAHLPTLYGLMGIAGFILLVAAVNFINLSTAQSMRRAKETGVRKVMGSSRASLVLQFLTETALVTILAIIVSVLLLRPVIGIFESFVPGGLAFDLFSSRSLLFLAFVALGTILLSGLYPALALSSWKPVTSLKGVSSTGGRSSRLRRGLIVFQFVVSLIFIAGTLIVGRQLNYMREKDLGFSSDAVVSVRIPWNGQDKAAVFTEKLKQQKSVRSVTKEWFPPMGKSHMVTQFKYQPEGKPAIEMDASAKIGDANFIPFYQLRLVAGRNYAESDSLRELVINETFSKALGFHQPGDAIGAMLEWQGGKKYPVVGVVADFHEQSFHEKIEPVFIGFYPQNARNLGVKLNTKKGEGEPVADAVAQMEKVWQSVYPDQTFAYAFLDESIAQLYEKEMKTGQLVNVATVIAILISCMGLLGLIAFTSEQRTKEIGIRKVLGASVVSIVSLLTADFVRLVLVALTIASPIAWWAMSKWLDDFAYRIDIQWWMFAAGGLAAMLIALLTVSWQAIKAAMMNPVKSLRTE